MPTLVITEKNKAARAIAEALGPVKSIKKSKINLYYVPSKELYIIPLRGHLLGYKNTEAYKSWTKSNPREIITNLDAIEKVPKSYATPYINALIEYGRQCIEVIIATDADIEGVNIGLFDALPYIKQVNSNILVTQMWLSSLQKNEILDKFKNRIVPQWSWGETGEARAIIDAIIGFSGTREITNTLRPLLDKLNRKFVSIGRVQTSLLYLIFLRDQRIKNFVPEPYFTIEANLNNQNKIINTYHQLNPFRKEQRVEIKKIYQKIKDEKIAEVINNTKNNVKRSPPAPLNTSKALILLTKHLKISASQALNTMNTLYLNKIISYPRTDSDVYKLNFDHIQYLQKFTSHPQYGIYSSHLLQENRIKPIRGKKDAGDHPPITPLESLDLNSKRFENDIQKRVYNLLARHYLALFGEATIESKTVLKLSIKGEPFIGRFVSLISEGFLEIAPFLKSKYVPEIIITSKTIPIDTIIYNEKETQPPPRYTDTTLLKLMETNHLGTKSTRPIIIQLLQNRNLIYRSKRKYFCTELGLFLIDNLKNVWLPLLEPKFTKFIEELLDDIKEKRKNMDEVIDIVKKTFLDLFDKFLEKKKKFISRINTFESKIKSMTYNNTNNKTFPLTTSMCPFCKTHPMKLVTTRQKKKFLACLNENCEKKYLSLPKRGRIIILKTVCSICGFNIFKINKKKNNKTFSYYICPKCWVEGLENKSGKGFCSKCKNYKIIKNQCVLK